MKPSKLIISLKTEAWILDDIQFGNSSQVILHGGDIPKHSSDVFSMCNVSGDPSSGLSQTESGRREE